MILYLILISLILIIKLLKKIENGTYVSSKSKWGIHLYKFENNEFVYYDELEFPVQNKGNELAYDATINRYISTTNNKLSWFVDRNNYNGLGSYGAVYIYEFENGVAIIRY